MRRLLYYSIDIKDKKQIFYISKEEDTIWWNQKTEQWDFYEIDKNSEGIYTQGK